jgi:hypothetical protein
MHTIDVKDKKQRKGINILDQEKSIYSSILRNIKII